MTLSPIGESVSWRFRTATAPALALGVAAVCAGALTYDLTRREDLALTAGLGLALLGAGAATAAAASVRVKDLATLSAASEGAILTVAPVVNDRALRRLSPDMRQPASFGVQYPASNYAEAFRAMRIAAGFGKRGGRQVVAMVGPGRKEGATTMALSLARSVSQLGQHAVILDCDLRTRGLTTLLGLDAPAGVWEAVRGADWRALIQRDPLTGLDVLPASPSDNAMRELCDGEGLPSLLDQLCSRYELVVLDCPGLTLNAESARLAALADATALVVHWNATPLREARSGAARLRRAGATLAGLVVNRGPVKLDGVTN